MSTLAECLDFLERVGADASLREAESYRLAESLADGDINPVLWKPILAGDPEWLKLLLGTPSQVCCLIAPGKEDEEEEEEEEDEEEEAPDGEEPDDEEAQTRKLAASSVFPTR